MPRLRSCSKSGNPRRRPRWSPPFHLLAKPKLLNGFARRLAGKLDLPFAPILDRTRDTRPQKEMRNSIHQVRNLLGAFSIEGTPPRGAVLLVDDVVDSGWTLTLLAALLRQRGSGPVHPFALAKASPREDDTGGNR